MPAHRRLLPPLLLLAVPCALAGCGGGEKQYTVHFSAQVAGQPLQCGTSYEGLGTTRTHAELLDFKAYVHGLTLVRANGERFPLALAQDGRWQHEDVALLDFEDGTGRCTGNAETRTEVVGSAPAFDDYTGVELTLGVPEEKNHLNNATAAPPLNAPEMFWGWMAGYKFVRLEVRTPVNNPYLFHLGSTDCTGSPGAGFSCAASNQARLAFSGFNPEKSRLVFDVAALFAGVDLDQAIDGQTDLISGCMSEATDPECPALFSRVGLGPQASSVAPQDAFLRVE